MTIGTNRTKRLANTFVLAIFVLALLPACGRHHPRAFAGNEDGWIGVQVQDLDAELRDHLNIDARYGVMVNRVIENSPADKAGLRDEDVIVRFDGRRVRDAGDLVRLVKRTRPEDRVEVEVIRKRRSETLRLRVGERRSSAWSHDRRPDRTDRRAPLTYQYSGNRGAWLGVRMAEMNDDLAEYFDVRRGEGVLVLSVEDDSPAREAGLRGGDVIVQIDHDEVNSPSELAEAIARHSEGDEIEIRFKRKGRTSSASAVLAGSSRNPNFNFNFNMNPDVWRHELKERGSWDRHELKDKLRDLRDKIRTEVRENIRKDVRRIRYQIKDVRPDVRVDVQRHILQDINDEVHQHVQAEIDQNLEHEMQRLDEELNKLHLNLNIKSYPEGY